MRPARPEDAAAALLYESAAPYYDAYAGGTARARRLLRALYPRGGHTASWEVCRVAEHEGRVVGVLAAFATEAGDELARRFVRLTMVHSPPWRLPGLFRHLRATSTISPQPPPRQLLRRRAGRRRRRAPPRRGPRGCWPRPSCSPARRGWRRSRSTRGSRTARPARSTSAAGFAPRGLRPAPDASDRARGRRHRASSATSRALSVAEHRCVSASATRSTWLARSSGKNGSAIERAATRSQTGNSPSRWPKRSR